VQIELSGPIDYSFNVGHHSNTVHHGWARYCGGSCDLDNHAPQINILSLQGMNKKVTET